MVNAIFIHSNLDRLGEKILAMDRTVTIYTRFTTLILRYFFIWDLLEFFFTYVSSSYYLYTSILVRITKV